MINFNKCEFETSVANLDQLPKQTGIEVVISGRSNVGKSSFINRLVSRKSLARVSSKPGKTVCMNFYKLDKIKLVDLPGYGYAKVPFSEKIRWSKLVEGYFNQRRDISLVVQLVDCRHTLSSQDIDMIKYLATRNLRFIVVATKTDRLNKLDRIDREEDIRNELLAYSHSDMVMFSSVTGEGAKRLQEIFCSLQQS